MKNKSSETGTKKGLQSITVQYTGVSTVEEIREAISMIDFFLKHLDTCDFEAGQKILFMRLQTEVLYKQILPFMEIVAVDETQRRKRSVSTKNI